MGLAHHAAAIHKLVSTRRCILSSVQSIHRVEKNHAESKGRNTRATTRRLPREILAGDDRYRQGHPREDAKLYPTALELVYDNYNALVIGYGATERASEFIFSVAIYPKWVNLFFAQGVGLSDPQELLKGSGTAIRHIRLDSPALLDDPAVRTLMKEAVSRADVPFDPKGTHRLIIKSISAKQRPRRPALSDSKSAKPKKKISPTS